MMAERWYRKHAERSTTRDNVQFISLAPFRSQGRAAGAVQAPYRPLSASRAARDVYLRLGRQQLGHGSWRLEGAPAGGSRALPL